MANGYLVVYFPVAMSETGEVVAVTLGNPILPVGQWVDLRDDTNRAQIHDLYLLEVDTFRLPDTPLWVLDTLDLLSWEALHGALAYTHKREVEQDALVTAYRLTQDEATLDKLFNTKVPGDKMTFEEFDVWFDAAEEDDAVDENDD